MYRMGTYEAKYEDICSQQHDVMMKERSREKRTNPNSGSDATNW